MITKVNLDVVAETKEEKEIEQYLNMLHQSSEIQDFLQKMKKEAIDKNVFKYRARIKDVKSAIRTYRINGKKLDDVSDYVGISFITNNEDEIYPIISDLKKNISNGDFVDFVNEEYIYSPLVYIKWVPPLGYNILAKEPLIENERNVPIEIRVSSKEAYISEQSAYYSVKKNDSVKMPEKERNNLRDVVQHIAYKFALLNIRELTDEQVSKHEKELNSLISNNYEFLKKHEELCKEAMLDFGKLVYRCEHDKEISENEKNLTKDEIDRIDYNLKKNFENFLNNDEDTIINKVHEAVKKINGIKYEEIKKIK